MYFKCILNRCQYKSCHTASMTFMQQITKFIYQQKKIFYNNAENVYNNAENYIHLLIKLIKFRVTTELKCFIQNIKFKA